MRHYQGDHMFFFLIWESNIIPTCLIQLISWKKSFFSVQSFHEDYLYLPLGAQVAEGTFFKKSPVWPVSQTLSEVVSTRSDRVHRVNCQAVNLLSFNLELLSGITTQQISEKNEKLITAKNLPKNDSTPYEFLMSV